MFENFKNSTEVKSLNNAMSGVTQKKITTASIGQIASVEKFFGHLWGHNKTDKTPEELEMYNVWLECRKEMLDKSNHQLRTWKLEFVDYINKVRDIIRRTMK